MKVISFINRIGIVAYIAIIIITFILNVLSFKIIDSTVNNVLTIIYFIILILAMISFYNSKEKDVISIALIFLPFILLLTGIPFKVITMISVLPLFFVKGIKAEVRMIGVLIYWLLIIIGIFGICLSDFGAKNIIDQKYSPNGIYRTVTIDVDQGALGGDTIINLERLYFGIMKKDIKILYRGHWGEKPTVIWLDNKSVRINQKDFNIYTSKTWDTRD